MTLKDHRFRCRIWEEGCVEPEFLSVTFFRIYISASSALQLEVLPREVAYLSTLHAALVL
jgi:hypothetical protein